MKKIIKYISGHIFLSKNNEKIPKSTENKNISTWNHAYINGYDTMNPCSQFEVNLMRT